MSFTINNPPNGNCGFNAFAIGLIDLIQTEYAEHHQSPSYRRWVENGLDQVSLEELLEFDLASMYNTPQSYKSELLNKLQLTLRKLVAQESKTDLISKIETEYWEEQKVDIVEGSKLFGYFLEVVRAYRNGSPSNKQLDELAKFNHLVLSKDLMILAKKTSAELPTLIANKSFFESQRIENAHIKAVLLKDVMTNDEVNPNSVILNATNEIIKEGRWATHSDLSLIAGLLQVNLIVTGTLNGALLPDAPTIQLNNQNNSHWTTEVKKINGIKPIAPEAQETLLTNKAIQIVARTVETQSDAAKAVLYKAALNQLMKTALSTGLFASVKDKLDTKTLDDAKAKTDENGILESDESFALRLQEAELRGAGIK